MTSEDRYILKPLLADGKRGYRLEIDEFMADNAMVNLYLLALRDMYKDSLKEVGQPGSGKPDYLKYYALSAVHGEPREDWDGYPNKDPALFGYCHHSRNTFPTWHRPYMMLYETAVCSSMQRIAGLYKAEEDKARYLDAAARFRLPYWDPLMPRNKLQGELKSVWGLPQLFAKTDVYVRLPESPDTLTKIPNPMYQYSFPSEKEWNQPRDTTRPELDMASEGYNPLHTVRRPNAKDESDIKALDQAIREQSISRASTLWRLLAPSWTETNRQGVKIAINEVRNWNSFANDSVSSVRIGGQDLATESLEMWHDGVHNLIGTSSVQGGPQGAMGNPAVAGFEPMFWMHHNNIDRLLSLYQALYNKNVDTSDLTNPLFPFKKDVARNCFTSADEIVKSYWSPGYAVPGPTQLAPSAARSLVEKYLTDTYYWATMYAADADKKVLPNWPKDLSQTECLSGKAAPSEHRVPLQIKAVTLENDKPVLVNRSVRLARPAQERTVEETPIKSAAVLQLANSINTASPADTSVMQLWNAHIRVRKYALNGYFNIHLFIGWVKDTQPERFLTKKNEVGFTGIFASPDRAQCASCKENRDADIMVEDVIPLTTTLHDYLAGNPKSGGLIAVGEKKVIESLEPAEVVPFLREHLRWRMTDLRSRLVEAGEQAAGLEVVVTNQTYEPPSEGSMMGSYGPPRVYEEITRGQPGGLGYVYP